MAEKIGPRNNPKQTDAQTGGAVDVLADLQDAYYMVQQDVYSDVLTQSEQDFICDLHEKYEGMANPQKDFTVTPNDMAELKRLRDKMIHG